MKKYVVIGAYASFMSGVLMLTREQYKAREHALEPLSEDLYNVIQQTGFKRDEIVGFDGEVNKALLQDITPMPEATAAEPALLDGTVKEIKEALPDLPEERLFALLEEECAGKQRKGVVEAIEVELDARSPKTAGNDNDDKAGDNAE